MRAFTADEARALPLSGLLYANVQVHGRGSIPTAKVGRRYSGNRAHLVLEIEDKIIQPVTKESLGVQDASWVSPIQLFTWYNVGNVSLLTGGSLGFDGAKAEMEFAFHLTPEQLRQKALVILIDGDGNKHKNTVDLSSIK